MYRFFYICAIALLLFEVANCILLVPLSIREGLNNLEVSRFLFEYRWTIRIELFIGVIFGLTSAFRKSRIGTMSLATFSLLIIFLCNFKYTATKMYRRPSMKLMVRSENNIVDQDRLVVGVIKNCEARAYPIQYLAYHQRVFDGMCGKRFMVTYSPVNRIAKVYLTDFKGKNDYYRLLGMNNNDALYEDFASGTWWSQSTGIGISGERQGDTLRQWPCYITTLRQWLLYNPESLVMQPDQRYMEKYKELEDFEYGNMFENFACSKREMEKKGTGISEQYPVNAQESKTIFSKIIQTKNSSIQ